MPLEYDKLVRCFVADVHTMTEDLDAIFYLLIFTSSLFAWLFSILSRLLCL